MIQLRPYQLDGIERVRECLRHGRKRVLLVAPTGAGKTVIAANVVSNAVGKGTRVLFVAHRRELIKQTLAKLVQDGIPAEQIGIIMAGVRGAEQARFASMPSVDVWAELARRRPQAPVQIASIDTLRGRQKPPAELVIIDEAHRALAKSYADLRELYPVAVHLGLTATPYRADGRGLGETYEELVAVATPRQLIGEGFLVEPRVFTVPAKDLPDLSRVKCSKGDYDDKDLSIAIDQVGLVGNIVEHWQRLANGIRTVVFATSVSHSKHIVERFRDASIAAEHLDGTTPTADRDAILSRLESGATVVVSNCDVLSEGWDMPSVKCCVLAKPTKSTTKYLQKAGRILRPYNGETAIILDHAGCAIEHGLPQDDREFTLFPTKKKKGPKSEVHVKTCPQCYAVLPPSTKTCPSCGFVFGMGDALSVPEEAEGELVEVARDLALESLRAELNKLASKLDVVAGERFGTTHQWLVRTTGKKLRERSPELLRACIARVNERIAQIQTGKEPIPWAV